ncbi:carboxymethylenebutenolidase protein [Rutstroemia sp. NJR-2017a WRK4]|nr:carboxymethylenebutenolidase protein [Rutstroemia sp. NJR-2017a WRK4]
MADLPVAQLNPSENRTPVPLSFHPITIDANVALQEPLTRRGIGPGLLLITPAKYGGREARNDGGVQKTLDPEPLQKWAEEGFVVVEVKVIDDATDAVREAFKESLAAALGAFKTSTAKCTDPHSLGVISRLSFSELSGPSEINGAHVYTADSTIELEETLRLLLTHTEISSVICYEELSRIPVPPLSCPPLMIHSSHAHSNQLRAYDIAHIYEDTKSAGFTLPGHDDYEPGAANVAHTRSLGFFKKLLNGPFFDLEAIWDEHTLYEFGERDVAKTMNTMVEEPYVNHVPTITGGIGRKALTAFYTDHFVFNNPEDTKLELVSRTVGTDRVIDEFIFSFTHDRVIDWLIPGIPPTNKHVRIPFTSVVNVRGDRLYHEHIAWDQATVLRQLGLLPGYLPFPYPLPDGRTPAKGKRFEYRVPTAGAETAQKLLDESSVVSNHMFRFEIREVDDI